MRPEDIYGLIDNKAGAFLRALAGRVHSDQQIVEIGSFTGKSTCFLADGAPPRSYVHAVDLWDLHGDKPVGGVTGPKIVERWPDVWGEFRKNVTACGLDLLIHPHTGFSTTVAHDWGYGLIGLLYIDGDHSYQGVTDDIEAWFPHLAPNAVVAFDDYGSNSSVKKAVDRLALPMAIGADRFAVVYP